MTEPDMILMKALRRILRPMVRLLVRKGVAFAAGAELLKELYVSVVEEQGPVTDDRIHSMTGIPAADVKKYRQRECADTGASPRLSRAAELLATWVGTKEYLDESGKPRALSGAGFAELAAGVAKDIDTGALLEELLLRGVVSRDAAAGTVSLKTECLVPQKEWEEKLYYFGMNSGDHLNAAVSNILSDAPLFPDRSVYHGGLTVESAGELKRAGEEHLMQMLRAVNRRAFELSVQDKGKPDACHRINLGAYFYTEKK